ncbi:tRNA pseudouridine(55) synthase TruB [Nibricoccus sp. IMCC34717]|uniref:tRNA pseudouridine(55) synthase TruB n=1 Tax=Nibricoccus sp. IMCC34717 TaxID=3034021 RepID=UPI003851360A
MVVPSKELEGVLLVDKPTDHTSHDVIARLRGILHMKRIGHAGTLDPMATGVLVVLVGKATRASQYLMSLDKEYCGTIKLGAVTNTQDAEGEILETRPVGAYTPEQLAETAKSLLGDQYQMPPMFSAVKIDGVPLYKHARKGEEVEREPRFIRVSTFELPRIALPEIDFRLQCSKGTYVRTIAHDFGQKLGCGAHLSALRRTATGKFRIEQCHTLEKIQELGPVGVGSILIPVHEAVPTIAL